MNARSPTPVRAETEGFSLQPMSVASLDAVMALETAVYPFPWSRGNFIDSIAAAHHAWLLEDSTGLVGYCVAMPGFEEMHLLNITVSPTHQRQGHARRMLVDLVARCQARHARLLWLEVRVSNVGAQQAYRRLGFTQVSMRRNYYPAGRGRREDAIVMSLPIAVNEISAGEPATGDASAGPAATGSAATGPATTGRATPGESIALD